METKMRQIPFNLERALRIQNEEEEGKIVTVTGYNVRIICTDAKGDFPVIGLVSKPDSPNEVPCTFTKAGKFTKEDPENIYNLLLEIPIKRKRFALEPFSKVLIRDYETDKWKIDLFSNYTRNKCNLIVAKCMYATWNECIPYNDDTKHLLGTTNPFKY